MAYFIDDTVFNYLPNSDGIPFLAMGWISRDHSYTQGEVTKDFFRKLCQLLQNPWQPPMVSGGFHGCELCKFSGGAQLYQFETYNFSASSSRELFVPSPHGIFVAPVNIAHYIDSHDYYPSNMFQEAVMNCPDMKSIQYLKMILDGGVREWKQRIKIE